ncbi:hypothetical protein ACLKA7_007455 [Drosophila subpalustris]
MIQSVFICLLLAIAASELAAAAAVSGDGADGSRLAGIFVKDGNENGQLRFLAAGLNGNLNSNNNGLNQALNQYITNKQDMLEQLRPTSSNTGTGLGLGTGAGNGNAIYVNLGSASTVGTATATATATGTAGTGISNNQAALNQVIYGSTPVNNLLPQIVAQGVAQRQRPAGGNIRRGVVQRRRRVNNNGQRRRRKGNKGKNGNKRPQVLVVRPNSG